MSDPVFRKPVRLEILQRAKSLLGCPGAPLAWPEAVSLAAALRAAEQELAAREQDVRDLAGSLKACLAVLWGADRRAVEAVLAEYQDWLPKEGSE